MSRTPSDAFIASTFRLAFLLPFFSGPASLVSSIYMILLLMGKQDDRQRLMRRPKENFLLGMAILDTLASFSFSFSTLPGNRDFQKPTTAVDYFPHYGNVATCNAQGFLQQLSFGVPLYNMALSVHYVLTVVFGVQERIILRYIVPTAHLLIMGFIFSTACAALVMKLYNPSGVLGCWIHRVNIDGVASMERGVDANRFTYIFAGYHLMLSWCVILLSMLALFIKVRDIEGKSRRFSLREVPTPRSSTSRGSMELSRRAADLGLLYSAAFVLVYIPLSLSAVDAVPFGTTFYYFNRVLIAFFTPLQGVFNLLIYTSDQWLSWFRRRLPSACCYCCRPLREPINWSTVDLSEIQDSSAIVDVENRNQEERAAATT